MDEYRYTDDSGDILAVRQGMNDYIGSAMVDCDPDGGGAAVAVPAHALADVVTAMYVAAGQDAPPLPLIADDNGQGALERLLADLSVTGDTRDPATLAAALIDHGWRQK